MNLAPASLFFCSTVRQIVVSTMTFLILSGFIHTVEVEASEMELDGNVTKGLVLFNKRACASCHAIGDQVDSLGPNLSKLEKKLSPSEALQSILEPSKEIQKGYETQLVLTIDGKIFTGRVVEETDDQLTLLVPKDSKVEKITIDKDDIDDVQKIATSIMPTDLLKGLSGEQLGDLLAYLNSVGMIDPAKVAEPVDLHQHHHPMVATPTYGDVDNRKVLDNVDYEIEIGVVPKQMQYDTNVFNVRPGSRVKLTLTNRDEMQHNLFLCESGPKTWLDVAQAAWALGPDGPAKRYTPDSDKILHYTRLVEPNSSDSIYFIAPEKEGVYPYVCTIPGHAFLMRGEMHVLNSERGLADISYRYYEGSWMKLPDFDSLTPVKEGSLDSKKINLKPREQNDGFGFVFDGTLHAAVNGEYQFFLVSDDGSRLLIDGKTVAEADGIHAENDPVSGKVSLKKGAHQLRLQYFENGGGEALHAAWKGPGFKVESLTDGGGGQRFEEKADFVLKVDERPLITRANMPDSSPRTIAVGLLSGTNYCFDAAECAVRYGWTGEYLDVGPARGNGRGRGGGTCRILGERFAVGGDRFPLLIGGVNDAPQFNGYRRSIEGPEFLFHIADTRVKQFVQASPSRKGLQYNFRLEPAPANGVKFSIEPDGLEISSPHGTVSDGVVTISAEHTGAFSVIVEPRN